MTIIIPRDQEDFDASLARLMEADHPDKRISLVTDTPFTAFDVPTSLAVAAGFLPEQTEENSTPPPPAPLDGADPENPDTPAQDDGKSEEAQAKTADTPDGATDTAAEGDGKSEPRASAGDPPDSAADKTTGARGKGGTGKTKQTDAPSQGAERKGA